MARKEENQSLQNRLRAWWDTDTAKAVATIVAVLLIPASVIAWNYATTQGKGIQNQLDTDSSNGDIVADNEDTTGEETSEESAMDSENADANGETTDTTEGQESATEGSTENADQPTVGGLGSVDKLPNTNSVEKYSVVKGDNVYRISMKVCGNDSFYRANTNRDYLKVGQTLEVTCN